MPTVINLRNPALKDRHWDKITALVGVDIRNAESFSLYDLIAKGQYFLVHQTIMSFIFF